MIIIIITHLKCHKYSISFIVFDLIFRAITLRPVSPDLIKNHKYGNIKKIVIYRHM